MKQIENELTQQKNKNILRTGFDWNLILVIVLVCIFGAIMIYSASYYYAVNTLKKPATDFFTKQLIFVAVGLGLMFGLSFFKPRIWQKFWFPAIIAAVILALLVKAPGLGYSSHGASRWIKIGPLTLQVAEPIKVLVILSLAGILTKYRFNRFKHFIILLAGYGGFAAFLGYLTNNMSSAIIMFGMVYLTLLIMYPKQRWLLWFLVGGIVFVILVAAIVLMTPYKAGESFRFTRIRAWWDPTNVMYATDEAYQSTQALYAIASGGFFGRGLGQSLIKFRLPEPHNDYILAIVFEELGILGVLILSGLFFYLLYKIYKTFRESRDRFSSILVLGVFFQLGLQVVLNYAVTTGLIPTTGVTLPFISAGGASVTFLLAELGIVLACGRQNAERRIYDEAQRELEEQKPYLKQLREESRRRREQHE